MTELEELRSQVEATQFWTAQILSVLMVNSGMDGSLIRQTMEALKNHSPDRSQSGLDPSEFDRAHLAKMPHYLKFGGMIAEFVRDMQSQRGPQSF